MKNYPLTKTKALLEELSEKQLQLSSILKDVAREVQFAEDLKDLRILNTFETSITSLKNNKATSPSEAPAPAKATTLEVKRDNDDSTSSNFFGSGGYGTLW